jgi:FkbM family methyltransferase
MINTKNFPKISIITPNYNGVTFLEETIVSIVSQNYPNLEYIIIDGGSTDGSIEIIKKYEKYLSYWISEPDNGMYEAIQKGFDKSTGEIMSWLNSDDMYHKKSLFTIAEIFTDFSEVQWLTGYNTNYDEEGRTLFLRESYTHSKYDMFLTPDRHIQQESTFWRRTLWETAGSKIDTSLRYAGDFELWLRFFRGENLYRVDALIGGFRIRRGQLTHLFMDKYNEECKKVLKDEFDSCSYFDICMIEEIKTLQIKLVNGDISVRKKNKIETSLKQILDYRETLAFDFRNNKFTNREQMDKNKITKIMHKKHQNLSDFLNYIKTHHKFYPEAIIDVGVARGTFEIYETFPKSEIILIEPVEEFNNDLISIQNNYDAVSIFHCAVGHTTGIININVHDDLEGSSLYNEQEGKSTDGKTREIEIKLLDDICKSYIDSSKSILLKIDVQGAELDVLKGSIKLLPNIEIIVLEVSLHKFFINGPEFYDVIEYMNQIGYAVYDIFGFLYRPLDGSLAQVDIAFVKKDGFLKREKLFASKAQRALLKSDKTQVPVSSIYYDTDKIGFQVKYNKIFESISKLTRGREKYIVYGHGTVGKTIAALMPDNVVAFVDKQSDFMSREIVNSKVYSPKNLLNMQYDGIIISVLGREDEISSYLIQELQVNKNNIITLDI